MPAPQSVHEQFADRARVSPDAAALDYGGEHLTYHELNRRANQFAHHLLGRGIRPGELVALCLDRGPELLVALLGIMKAGAAYLPLDPEYPIDRLRFMIEDAGVRTVVAGRARVDLLTIEEGLEVCPEEDADAISAQRDSDPGIETPTSQLAYVIYTSGTTGRPKGVLVEHGSLTNHATAIGQCYKLGPGDRVLQLASIGFDVAAEEIFPTLARGACAVMRATRTPGSVAEFLEWAGTNGVTVLNLPAAFWHELVDDMERRGTRLPPSVRLVVAGSERVRPDRLSRWRKLVGPNVRWLNAYGPTEATITATLFEPDGEWLHGESGSVPIGKPIANVCAYVLDEERQPVAAGDPGELFLGGDCVARGYLNRVALTQERFVADPFDLRVGARMYKTGDLVRALPDGNLLFLGRVDRQVKVRGFRIELEEVELALFAHPEIRDAAVVARDDANAGTFLAAYIVPRRPDGLATASVRAFLRERVPNYMVPAAFTCLEQLPRLPNGKLDLRALPAIARTREHAGSEYVAPSTPTESGLSGLFSKLLDVDRVGVADGFFELGGHSLLAGRMIGEIRDLFGVDVSIGDIFDHPTPAGLAGIVEQRRAGRGTRRQLPPVTPADRTGDIPLSFSQEPVWFMLQLEPDNLAYNAQLSLRLTGRLDVDALRRALTEIVRRHEIFRTTFPTSGPRPVQRIHLPFTVEVPVIDLSTLADDVREAEAERLVAEECRHQFDVTRLPLVRWTLLRLAADSHVLIQVEQHFLHDGWSIAILMREIVELYSAFVKGAPSPLPEVPVQFADYAIWQRESLKGDAHDELLAFWRQRLQGSPPLLALPTDRPRPTFQTFRGGLESRDLDPGLYEAIREFGRRQGLTPFMVMMAAFNALLARYTGQTDLLVGTTVANRPLRELETVIGMMVNTIVLRTDCSGDPDFREMAHRVRRTALDAYAHQHLPFEKLVEHLAPQRNFSHNPIFQVMFSFHDAAVPDLVLPDLDGRIDYRHNGSAKFDVNIVVINRSEQRVGRRTDSMREAVTFELEYNTDLFNRDTITRMLEHYFVLLEAAVREPQSRLSALPLVSAAERERLLVAWNNTAAEYPSDTPVHDLIRARAIEHPDAVAVVFEDEQLTYGALQNRVERLARQLNNLGAGSGTRVAIYMHRSVEMMVALLGVLTAGAAYVPLDPTHPVQRTSDQLEDAGVAVVITHERSRQRLPGSEFHIVCLDAQPEPLPLAAQCAPLPMVSPDATAYVIYTSGSSGRPKGVQISHRSLVNVLTSMARRLNVGRDDVLLSVTTIAFDIAGLELYLPLVAGARVRILPSESTMDGRRLADALTASDATIMQATPATWRLLLQTGWNGSSTLKVLCGGEALPADLARALRTKCGALYNLYGPTETTIWSAIHEVRTEDDPVPIGAPIDNTTLHVVDERFGLVPVGIPGELVIGGDGVAQGYLNRDELTAERFVPDPFSAAPGRRRYRTGDLVRRRADGLLEFLGRLDDQVKLRGFRIELGEIESVLREDPGVRDAVVTLRELGSDDTRLVAYVVPASGCDVDSGTLRTVLATRLPEYMIPSAFVRLDALPLSSSGKIDRRSLPAPAVERTSQRGPLAPARTAVEETLVALWCDVLRRDQIGIDDNFFELGGHSLLATQVISRIRSAFGSDLPLRTLFEAPTVAGLAARLVAGHAPLDPVASRSADSVACGAAVVVLQPRGTRVPFFFLHAATDGDGFYSEQLGRFLGPEQPYYSLAPLGLDGSPIPDTVPAIAERYLRFVREQQPHGPYRLGGFCVSGPVVLEMARQLRAAGEAVALAVVVDSWVQNVSRLARATATLVTRVGRVLRLRPRAHVDLFLALRGLARRQWPHQPSQQGPLALQVRHHYIRAASAYVPEPSDLPLVHLRTPGDPDPCWRRLSSRFTDWVVPGDHTTCVTEHIGELAAALGRCLDDSVTQ